MRSRAYQDTVTCNKFLETRDTLLSSQLACLLQKILFSSLFQVFTALCREEHLKMLTKTLRMIAKRQGRCAVPCRIASPLYIHTHTFTNCNRLLV